MSGNRCGCPSHKYAGRNVQVICVFIFIVHALPSGTYCWIRMYASHFGVLFPSFLFRAVFLPTASQSAEYFGRCVPETLGPVFVLAFSVCALVGNAVCQWVEPVFFFSEVVCCLSFVGRYALRSRVPMFERKREKERKGNQVNMLTLRAFSCPAWCVSSI